MARWLTSDLHFLHRNIIRFCDRPFAEFSDFDSAVQQDMNGPLEKMTVAIVNNINALCGPEDELWNLGDLAMGDIDKSLKIPRRFHAGRMVFVAGNHDRCHPYNGAKHEKWIEAYSTATGFDEVHLTGTQLTLSDGTVVDVNHFPFGGPDGDARPKIGRDGKVIQDKFEQWRPVDTGDNWLLCGHVHEKWRQQGRQINVGIDAWGGRPVSEDEIIELIAAGPRDLPAIRWV